MSETRVFDKNKQPKKNSSDGSSGGGILKTLMKIGIALLIIGVVAIFGFYFAVLYGAFGHVPTLAELRAIQNPVASEIYSADNKLIGKFYRQNRTNIPYKEIPAHVVKALVATEDARFFEHKGVDTKSMFRVLIKSIILQDESSGGGSTITQQLIKNLFGRKRYSFLTMPVNKTREAIIARRMEHIYDKNDIVALYLNTVSFGENVYGIGTASERYFSSPAQKLTVEKGATLIGMLKATTSYNPRLNPAKAIQRRNVVLNQMQKKGYLSTIQTKDLKKRPLGLDYSVRRETEKLGAHFKSQVRQIVEKWAQEHPKSDGTYFNIYTDGLKIYTTLDSKMQTYAEGAVKEHMKKLQFDFDKHWQGRVPWGGDKKVITAAKQRSRRYKNLKAAGKTNTQIDRVFLKPVPMTVFDWSGEPKEKNMSPMDSIRHYLKFLNTGFVVMEPYSGHVKALVGSIDQKYFKYDNTNSRRQVGSTFKPIVYAASLHHEIFKPCQYFPNELRTYVDYDDWTPRNSDDQYGGAYSMRGGLAKSVNTVSVQIILETGVERVVDFAQSMGIKTDIPKVPSITLGTAEIPLREMVAAYSAFVNGGHETPAQYITKITNHSGKELGGKEMYTNVDYRRRSRIMEAETAASMVEMMEGVVDSGTARRLRSRYDFQSPMGGKTGTTQKQTDGWFMGITPKLVAGVWTGGSDRRIRFRSIGLGQGANMALPTWALFFKKLYNDPKYSEYKYATFKGASRDVLADLNCPIYVTHAPAAIPNRPSRPSSGSVFDEPVVTTPTTPSRPSPGHSTGSHSGSSSSSTRDPGSIFDNRPTKPTKPSTPSRSTGSVFDEPVVTTPTKPRKPSSSSTTTTTTKPSSPSRPSKPVFDEPVVTTPTKPRKPTKPYIPPADDVVEDVPDREYEPPRSRPSSSGSSSSTSTSTGSNRTKGTIRFPGKKKVPPTSGSSSTTTSTRTTPTRTTPTRTSPTRTTRTTPTRPSTVGSSGNNPRVIKGKIRPKGSKKDKKKRGLFRNLFGGKKN